MCHPGVAFVRCRSMWKKPLRVGGRMKVDISSLAKPLALEPPSVCVRKESVTAVSVDLTHKESNLDYKVGLHIHVAEQGYSPK